MAEEATQQAEGGTERTPQWAMAIDLDRCTGCEACVLACASENNVPTAGEDQAAMGRTKHWIRIDRYYEGEFPDIKVKYRPVMCQQCDEAPCEPVCPVNAIFAEDAVPEQWNSYIAMNYDYFKERDLATLKTHL